jgi:DNA-binding MarR family transcriptional regulator
MDYSELALTLLHNMHLLYKSKMQKKIIDSMQGELFVLQYIFSQDDEVAPGKIGSVMGISSARIAAALNGLENKGLVTRDIDKNDRRRIIVRLTDPGRDSAQKLRCDVVRHATDMLRLLGEKDAAEYTRITGRLAELSKTRQDDE